MPAPPNFPSPQPCSGPTNKVRGYDARDCVDWGAPMWVLHRRSLVLRLLQPRRLLGSVGLCLLVVLAGTFAANPAWSDPYGYPNPGFVHDGPDHYYCFHSSVPAGLDRSRINDSMNYLDSVTEIVEHLVLSCGTSTDLMWLYSSVAALGRTTCVKWANELYHVCDAYWVEVNPSAHLQFTALCAGGESEYEVNMILTVRHELGHTVGLSHDDPIPPDCGLPINGNDAMVSDWVPVSLEWLDYNNHHRKHVDCVCASP
jgi:hypothetical protein